jgi:hypothetical protein
MPELLSEVHDHAARAAHRQRTRMLEHYLFTTAAIVFALLVLGGFARSYYLRGIVAAPLPSWIVHVHGLLMTAWVALFLVQTMLIPAKRIRLHQRLGYGAIGLAVLIAVTGIWTAMRAAKFGSSSVPPGFSEPTFSIVPLGDILLFALFFGGAIYFRKNAATHKRLMLLTATIFLPPAVGRLPVAAVQAAPIAWLLGIIAGCTIFCLVFDRRRYGHVNRVFLGGALLLIASFPIRIAVMTTPAWQSISSWFASFA